VTPIPMDPSLTSLTPLPAPPGQIGSGLRTATPIPARASDPLHPAVYSEMPVLRPTEDGDILTLDEEEKRIILRTLSLTGGNISDAARRLGVHRSTLHRKMTRYGLATDDQLAAGIVNSEA